MPIRGESVGTAYVRILADGTGLPESIRDEMDGADNEIGRAGTRQSKEYQKAFGKEMEKDKDISGALNRALARNDFSNEFFKSHKWKLFQNRLQKEFGDAGGLAGRRMVNDFRRKGNLDGLVDAIENIMPRVQQAVEDIRDAQTGETDSTQRLTEATDDNTRSTRENVTETENAAESHETFRTQVDRTASSLRRAGTASENFGRSSRRTRSSVDKDHNSFRRFGQDLDRIGASMSNAFGKRSRNDFIHFVGSMVGVFFKLIAAGPKLIGVLVSIGQFFKSGAKQAEGMSDAVAGAESELGGLETAAGEVAATGPAGLIAMAAAAVIAFAAIGPLVSLMSTLAAAATALLGSLAFAAVGFIAPIAGLLIPLVAGLGVAFIAFKSVFSAADVLTRVLKPLKGAIQDIGDAARKPILNALIKSLKGMSGVLEGLVPLVTAVSRAIGHVIRGFADGLKSAGFKHFTDVLETAVPHMLRQIGRIIRQTIGGIGGVFETQIPSINHFLGFLDRVTKKFQDFANQQGPTVDLTPRGFGSQQMTGSGQNELLNFFSKAEESAKAVADAITSLLGLIGTLLGAGKDTGDSIFTNLADTFDRWNDSLKANPDQLEKWFGDGKEVVDALGDLLVTLGKIAGALDTPTNRNGLILGITLVGDAASAAVTPLIVVEGLIEKLVRAIQTFDIGNIFGNIARGFTQGPFGGLRTQLTTAFTSFIPGVLTTISGLGRTIASNVGSIVGSIPKVFGGLADRIGFNIGKVHLLDNFKIPNPSEIWSHFTGLAGAIFSNMGKVHVINAFIIPVLSDIWGKFTKLADSIFEHMGKIHLIDSFIIPLMSDIADKFKTLGQAIKDKIGQIDLTSLFTWHLPSFGNGSSSTGHTDQVRPPMGDPTPTPPSSFRQFSTRGQGSFGGQTRVFNVTQNIHSPVVDTHAVATAAINQLTAVGY